MRYLLVAFLISSSTSAAWAQHIGSVELHYTDPARKRPIEGIVWYPTSATKPVVKRINHDLFEPTSEIPNAPLIKKPDRFPLVLLSHGDSGNMLNQSWLGVELAKRGYIVAAIDHYGNTTEKSTTDALMKLWDRPLDVSFLLDQLLHHPTFGPRLDKGRIYAAGHSAGGAGVLMLAGGKLVHAQLASPLAACDLENKFSRETCAEVLAYDYKSLDKSKIETSYRDGRIKKFLALDPGFYAWFDQAGLHHLQGRTHVLVAGLPFYAGSDLKAGRFAEQLGKAGSTTMAKTNHMDFLPECDVPIEMQKKLPICKTNDRRKSHKFTTEFAVKFFK